VNSSINDLKIFNGIIHPVAILVMHMLPRLKGSTEVNLHDYPMDSGTSFYSRPGSHHITTVVRDLRPATIANKILIDFDLTINGKSDIFRHFLLQEKQYHKGSIGVKVTEGNAWLHSMEVLDRAAKIRKQIDNHKDKLVYMLAAWLHDIGKSSHTFYRGKTNKDLTHWTEKQPENTKIVSYGHDTAGSKMIKDIINREIPGDYPEMIQRVESLVANHMKPLLLKESTLKAFKKLQQKELELSLIGLLSWADKGEYPAYWFERVKELNSEKCQ
jgi:hypothetical protein